LNLEYIELWVFADRGNVDVLEPSLLRLAFELHAHFPIWIAIKVLEESR
jgi:hypothetical protein